MGDQHLHESIPAAPGATRLALRPRCRRPGGTQTEALLSGSARAADLGQELPEFAAVAREGGVSPQQVGLAWALDLFPAALPPPAARGPETILDSVAAARIQLTDD